VAWPAVRDLDEDVGMKLLTNPAMLEEIGGAQNAT